MLTFSFYSCLVLFVFVCLVLILLILIQKGRGGGLASAFGGAGGSTAFGAKTGDVLTWATSIVFGIFLLLAVILNLVSNAMDSRNKVAANQGVVSLPMTPPAMPTMPGGMGGGTELPAGAVAPTGVSPAQTPIERPEPAAPAAATPAPAASTPAPATPAAATPAPAPATPAPAPAAPTPAPAK